MNVVDELRKKIGKSSGIKNFGIGFDINKLIVLLNNFKVEIFSKDQDIKILKTRCTRYRSLLSKKECETRIAENLCPETCKKFSEDGKPWCIEVYDEIERETSFVDADRLPFDEGYKISDLLKDRKM